MGVHFHKMHGAGNDFVLLDLRAQSREIDARAAAGLANRQTGIGYDQLLVLRHTSTEGCLLEFEVWNADGSRAEQCGNGVRCIGLYLHMRGEAPPGVFRIRGPATTLALECLPDRQVRVDMGEPEFEAEAIPIDALPSDGWYRLTAGGRPCEVGAVSVGNPHAVLVVDDVGHAPVAELGPEIARHTAFPRGCNVGFAEVVDRRTVRLRVFERGVGETLACGSGACAAVAILRKRETVGRKVLVNQVGGDLIIEWPGNKASLMMTGPACHVFEGILK
jgi:diaminopimelate epimerase